MPDASATSPLAVMTWKRAFAALGIVVFGLGIVGTIARLRNAAELHGEVVRLQVRVEKLEEAVLTLQDVANQRLEGLERTVFGELYQQVTKPTTSPATSALIQRRQRELEERIMQLERWRLFGRERE